VQKSRISAPFSEPRAAIASTNGKNCRATSAAESDRDGRERVGI
jgi:hypothetical protein